MVQAPRRFFALALLFLAVLLFGTSLYGAEGAALAEEAAAVERKNVESLQQQQQHQTQTQRAAADEQAAAGAEHEASPAREGSGLSQLLAAQQPPQQVAAAQLEWATGGGGGFSQEEDDLAQDQEVARASAARGGNEDGAHQAGIGTGSERRSRSAPLAPTTDEMRVEQLRMSRERINAHFRLNEAIAEARQGMGEWQATGVTTEREQPRLNTRPVSPPIPIPGPARPISAPLPDTSQPFYVGSYDPRRRTDGMSHLQARDTDPLGFGNNAAAIAAAAPPEPETPVVNHNDDDLGNFLHFDIDDDLGN